MKKIFCLLIIILLFFVLVSGCISKPEDDCEGADAPPLPMKSKASSTTDQNKAGTGKDANK